MTTTATRPRPAKPATRRPAATPRPLASRPSTAHLSAEDVEEIGRRFDAIGAAVRADLGADDARYIRRVIGVQRGLEVGGRALLFASLFPPAWVAGTTLLSVAKILENMEIGHNILHGQWDWMRDPEIHSTVWEWDSASTSQMWQHSHNVIHHRWTNVIGKDRDVGYAVLRVTDEQRWHPVHLAQPLNFAALVLFFQWGVALHDLEIEKVRRGQKSREETVEHLRAMFAKGRKQALKDYVVFPALAGPAAPLVLGGTVTANVVRNVWSSAIIFCGHFPDGAEHFTVDEVADESRGEWYLRQMLGSADMTGGRLFHLMSGNLGYQIEHHLFPDLPSNRYPEVAVKVRAVCQEFGLPYTTGSFVTQYGQVLRSLARLTLPPRARLRLRRRRPARVPVPA